MTTKDEGKEAPSGLPAAGEEEWPLCMAGKPYRPSNGTEGMCFMGEWCDCCARDEKFRETQDGADSCPIAAATFVYAVDDPKYPKEWVYDAKGHPICTAWVIEGQPFEQTEADKKYLAWKAEQNLLAAGQRPQDASPHAAKPQETK